jgi:phosphatidylserine/phosphatidylglycerophosphate/cardiolipin synthase-like enzyme
MSFGRELTDIKGLTICPRYTPPRQENRFQMTFIATRVAATCLIALASAASLSAAELRPCFTPGEDCTAVIVRQIDRAQNELLVQAYQFTNTRILQALARAWEERGVEVRVLLDKINEQKRYTAATYLLNHGIDVLIDDKVAIAHNTVIVIDGRDVIIGSFNFTTAAQRRNAENVLLISDDPVLAKAYAENWKRRERMAREYNDFRSIAPASPDRVP